MSNTNYAINKIAMQNNNKDIEQTNLNNEDLLKVFKEFRWTSNEICNRSFQIIRKSIKTYALKVIIIAFLIRKKLTQEK